MAEFENLKRKIVRETVAENVALMEGARRARRRRAFFGPWRRGIFLALLLGALGTSVLLSRPWASPRDAAAASAPADEVLESPSETGSRQSGSRWAVEGAPPPEQIPDNIDPSVFPLRVRHIVLDPGHGGEDLGTQAGPLFEKELTLAIALRLRERLEAESFTVSMTRETDRAVVLRERRDFANEQQADVFVSIHVNWIANREVRGVETYFLGTTKDPVLNAFAQRENKHSGYTMSEQSDLILSLILNAQHERSRHLASRVQSSLFRSLRGVNPLLLDRGVKTAPFVVLIDTEMPAILAEVSCLSNQEEVELLQKPRYLDNIAEALFKGILGYARDVNPTEENLLGL